jgi:hypothetical protein
MNATLLVRPLTTALGVPGSGALVPIETDSGRTMSLTGPCRGEVDAPAAEDRPVGELNAGAPPPLVSVPSRKFDSPMKSATKAVDGP